MDRNQPYEIKSAMRWPRLVVVSGTFTTGAAPTITDDADNLVGDTAQGTAPTRVSAGLYEVTVNGLFGKTPKIWYQYIRGAVGEDFAIHQVSVTPNTTTGKTAIRFATKTAGTDTDGPTGAAFDMFMHWDDFRTAT
jgi:hypothetical protein